MVWACHTLNAMGWKHGSWQGFLMRIIDAKGLKRCFYFPSWVEKQRGWDHGCGELQSRVLQASCNGVFIQNCFFPLCLPQWIFSYSILLKDCGDGLKLLFTSKDMPKITSLNAVCNSWFDSKAPLHKGQLWTNLVTSLCLGKASVWLLTLAEKNSGAGTEFLGRHPHSSGFMLLKSPCPRVNGGCHIPVAGPPEAAGAP